MYRIFEVDECLFPNCVEKNIKSHAVSRNISLELIADEYHLFHSRPRQFCKDKKEPKLQKISTQKATAFSCFCDDHDDFFQSLDDNEIKTSEDILLQAYRSVSIILNEEKASSIQLFSLNKPNDHERISTDSMISFLSNKGYSELIDELDNDSVKKIVKNKIFFEIEEAIEDRLMEIEKLSDYLKKILNYSESKKIKTNVFQTLTTNNMGYTLFYYKTDFQIPIAINSINPIRVKDKQTNFYTIVIPYKNNNIIIGIVPNELLSIRGIADKLDNYFTKNIKIVDFIESMVSITDGWYIKPTVIEKMSDDKFRLFEEDCMFTNERQIFEDYDLTIFDELRKSLAKENLENEIKKQNMLPTRQPYEIRYENMVEAFSK